MGINHGMERGKAITPKGFLNLASHEAVRQVVLPCPSFIPLRFFYSSVPFIVHTLAGNTVPLTSFTFFSPANQPAICYIFPIWISE
jgi:hypothetical protein